MRLFALVFAVSFAVGCARIPESGVTFCALDSAVSSDAYLRKVIAAVPPTKYTVVASAVVTVLTKRIPVIAMIAVDDKAKTFSIAACDRLGVKLLEVEGDAHGERLRYALPSVPRKNDVAKAAANLVRAVCFDVVPPAGAEVHERSGDRIVYAAPLDGGEVRWTTGGATPAVAEKSYWSKGKMRWIAIFDASQRTHGRLFPTAVDFVHKAHHYRVRVNVKEIRI